MIRALEKIAAELEALARDADAEHPIDPHEVTIAVVRIRAQADMIAKGLTE